MITSSQPSSGPKLGAGRIGLVFLSLLAGLAFTSVLLGTASKLSAAAQGQSPVAGTCDPDMVQPNGSIYRFCLPPGWDGKGLVVYAHGYIWFNEPLTIPQRHICFGDVGNETCVNDVINDLGVAFATSSYPTNGLAVLPAVDDMANLVKVFSETYGAPETVLIAGVSEGGLVTALAVERLPHVFDGGLAACGPIGNWVGQVNYLGDFRVLFDYFFPDLVPSDVITIPSWLIDQWSNHDYFGNVIEPIVFEPASAYSLTQLLATSQLPHVPSDTSTIRTAVHDALAYNVLATNDAMQKLGGNPFDNVGRIYSGSADDGALNAGVRRFGADQAALVEMEKYETSGLLSRPLVTLHTSQDQQVPQWHEADYRLKVLAKHRWMWHADQPVPVDNYGHCNFDPVAEVMPGFFTLLGMVADPPRPSVQFMPAALRESALPAPGRRLPR